MERRKFIDRLSKICGMVPLALLFKPLEVSGVFALNLTRNDGKINKVKMKKLDIEKLVLSDQEWKKRLTPEQYDILRNEGTERPFTSDLNDEKREGVYHCVGCNLEVFTSEMKYDSGTGWPSFYTTLEGVFETTTDYKMILPRTEYHCARCGGHHGHVFKDGPPPTGERWCNNGIALKFTPGEINASQ